MSLSAITQPEVSDRADRIGLDFNRYGLDEYGVSRSHVAAFFSFLRPFYRRYFSVDTYGLEHIPSDGGAMLVGNHSGGVPVDGAMVLASLFFELDPPRLGHGMVDKFANRWPIVSQWFSRVGQLTGLPKHAVQLLEDDRLLMVFPEGTRGIGKLYEDRYEMVEFGTGFMRIALEAGTPIVPFAFIGGEEALPTVVRLETVAKMIGIPYIPVPPHLLPIPLPVHCEIHYGEPMVFEGTGSEADSTIEEYIERVKGRIAGLIEEGRAKRRRRLAHDEPGEERS